MQQSVARCSSMQVCEVRGGKVDTPTITSTGGHSVTHGRPATGASGRLGLVVTDMLVGQHGVLQEAQCGE